MKDFIKQIKDRIHNDFYFYTLDRDNHVIVEHKGTEQQYEALKAASAQEVTDLFPYIEAGFEDPYALLHSEDWICKDESGRRIVLGL